MTNGIAPVVGEIIQWSANGIRAIQDHLNSSISMIFGISLLIWSQKKTCQEKKVTYCFWILRYSSEPMKNFIRGPQAYLAWAYRPSPKVSQPNSLKPSSAEEICEIKHTFDVAAQVLTAWPIVHFQGVVFHHCFGNGISYYTTLWLWVTANILISSERSRSFSCNQLTDTWQSSHSAKSLGTQLPNYFHLAW